MFPVGDSPKPDIRAEAEQRGLLVANKPDSHDICFIPSGDTQAFLGARIGVRRGNVVDADGSVLATHAGVHEFTIGQRKGLGLVGPAPDSRPDTSRRSMPRLPPSGWEPLKILRFGSSAESRWSGPPAGSRANPSSVRCRSAHTGQ